MKKNYERPGRTISAYLDRPVYDALRLEMKKQERSASWLVSKILGDALGVKRDAK